MPSSLGHSESVEAVGSPPSAPGPSSYSPCTQCGSCMFSSNSKLTVEKVEYTCVGFPPALVATTITEDWPLDSVDANRVRYELDANNWAEYSCENGTWSWGATDSGIVGGACIGVTTPPYQFDKCRGFENYRYVNGVSSLIIKGTVKLNDCTPLGIA